MASLHHFVYGWVTPVAAYAMSALGCLLGCLIAAQARKFQGARRAGRLVYAALAVGAAGIWLMHVIALLGFGIEGSVVRYDPGLLSASFLVGVLDLGTGLFIAGFGKPTWWRLLAAGAVIALGTTATQYVAMSAIRFNGVSRYDWLLFGVSVLMSIAFAGAALWCTLAATRIRVTVIASAIMAVALTGMHYAAVEGIRAYLNPNEGDGVPGLSRLTLLVPAMIIGGVALTMLAYFSLGGTSMHEIRSIYRADVDSGSIEPDFLEEVTSRIGAGVSLNADQEPAEDVAALDQRLRRRTSVVPPLVSGRPPRPRPTPGTMPTWASMAVWGDETAAVAPVSGAVPAVGAGALPAVGAVSLPAGSVSPTDDAGTVYGRSVTAHGAVSATEYGPNAAATPGTVAVMAESADMPGRYPPGYNAERAGRTVGEIEPGPGRPRNQRRR